MCIKIILYTLQIDLIVSMHQLIFIWCMILLYTLLPVIIIVVLLIFCFLICFVCPCLICYCAYAIYHEQFEDDKIDNLMDRYFLFFEYLFQESEPKLSTSTVHPFKLRSPLSASKRYKSPKNLAKIIEKPSPEVSNLYIILLLPCISKFMQCHS